MTRLPWTAERLLEMLTLAGEGHGPESIASQLGEPLEDVEVTLKRLGWLAASPRPGRKRPIVVRFDKQRMRTHDNPPADYMSA